MSTLSLAFQKEIVAELVAEDALLIMAKGLGLRSIIGAFLKIYSQPQNLVLLINTNAEEEAELRDDLARSTDVGKGGAYFRTITSEQSLAERNDLYRYGGIMAVTSRILVMDLLTARIPIHLITGILVANAHRVTATSTEAFILRLLRQSNSEAFIKAFSDQPESFTVGFATLEKTLKLLYLRKVNLWPRFHVTVTESLESHSTDVIEIRQPMTKAMKTIQAAIIDCMDICLQELRRSSSAIELDIDDFTVEKALFKSFDVIIRKQLDPIWHRVTSKTKQLVGDLKTLRNLLSYLVSYDSVNFNLYLETILATHNASSGNYWLLTDPADKIYTTAKSRVFLHQMGYQDPDDPSMLPNTRPIVEELPKWNVLSEIMDEIELEMHHAPHKEGQDTVLIMTQDQRTCTQLKRYLSTPKSNASTRGKPLMRNLLQGYLRWKANMKNFKDMVNKSTATSAVSSSSIGNHPIGRGPPPNKRRRVRGGGNMVALTTKPTTASFDKEVESIATFIHATQGDPSPTASVHDHDLEEIDDPTDYFGLVEPSTLVIVHSYTGESDARLLENIKPRFIVMYDPDPTFVRCIEVYKATQPGKQVRVYFTVYDNSVEEQLYLSALRREKDAFTKLIHDKAKMVLPIGDTQTKQVQDQSLLRNIHTRIAGGGKTGEDHPLPRIVVDSREFRSSLPSILHSQGMVLDPCTITVGDYVLSPNICVERKSISDLISSFASGRLYTQVEAMTVHYSQPVLLIEFDQEKSFSLQDKSEIRSDISVTELSSKLVLLTIAFPTLKLIWSSSVHATVEIFEDLKRSENEPDVLQAQAVGVDQDQEIESAFNLTPQDILRSMPGITSKNYKHIMNNVESIRELVEMEMPKLVALLGEGPAQTLWNFLHKDSRLDMV
ncbi:DNA repair protein [Lobosporangium transversale]|uniref:DNA repair protein n=1 Tax=Lobosporangium transversale TaxID=64571 RepID=A0A1Y2GAL2_9FUNG|nr:DNA repair protein [Lobosporangium transversale]ORZ05671.1 DNA repair protein [Lobosporangium transversale]|eukprot:XP_021877158.1 DNA repair protein [Lobosporangium transversale]